MSVAKSYENMKFLGSPYEKENKFYVKVAYPCCSRPRCKKCGGQGFYPKEVRWYGPTPFNARYAFGFRDEGYITLLINSHAVLDDWFRNAKPGEGRYNLLFQWYIPSYLSMPELPQNTRTVRLDWEQISKDGEILDYSVVREIVRRMSI